MKTQVIRRQGKLWCVGPGIPVRIMTDKELRGLYSIEDYENPLHQYYEQVHPGTQLRYRCDAGVLVDITRITPEGKEIPINGQHFITEHNPMSDKFYYTLSNDDDVRYKRDLRLPLMGFAAAGFKKRHK